MDRVLTTGTAKTPPAFRTPMVLMALANLAMLGVRLWPWQEIHTLPSDGTAGFDPLLTLAGYVAVGLWVGSARTALARRLLFSSALFGLAGGVLLAWQVTLAEQSIGDMGSQLPIQQFVLIGVAIVLWGVCGFRAIRGGQQAGFAALCGLWAAMVSSLMASASLLAGSFYSAAPGQTADPWKQYEGLAIGSEAMQALVHTLVTATGYLLIGPIVGCIAGAVFAAFARTKTKADA